MLNSIYAQCSISVLPHLFFFTIASSRSLFRHFLPSFPPHPHHEILEHRYSICMYMSWSVHLLEKNFQTRSRMRGELSLSEWETLSEAFPSSSESKEAACNAGDPGSIPGLGISPVERHGGKGNKGLAFSVPAFKILLAYLILLSSGHHSILCFIHKNSKICFASPSPPTTRNKCLPLGGSNAWAGDSLEAQWC